MEVKTTEISEDPSLLAMWQAFVRVAPTFADESFEIALGTQVSPLGTNGEVLFCLIETGAGVDQSIYIGQQYDAENSLLYLNARYMNPLQGQFLSEDSIFLGAPKQQNLQDPQSLNAYSYSEDNPITKKDPTGKYFEISYSSVQKSNTFTFGLRFDSNGIDFFAGGGKGVGYETGVEAAYTPGPLTHQVETSNAVSGETADVFGLRVTQNIIGTTQNSNQSGSVNYGGRPSIGVVVGEGSGAGGDTEISFPIITW